MDIKKRLLNHFKYLQTALGQVAGAEAFLNVDSFVVEVRIANRVYRLLPSFLLIDNGRVLYVPKLSPKVNQFAGWRPYIDRPIPLLGKKINFKNFLKEHRFKYPLDSALVPCELDAFLIKRNISSFGADIRGPFRAGVSIPLNTEIGEYCEQFIVGDIVKIWYHNADALGLEYRAMPFVVGDGQSTIRELAAAKISRPDISLDWPKEWATVEQVLAFDNVGFETVLAMSQHQRVDFRYGSPFLQKPEDTTDIKKPLEEEGAEVLPILGQKIYESLPNVWQTTAIYSIDAIRTPKNEYYFLEANFNTYVHPAVYPAMIAALHALPDYQELRFVPATG